MSRAPGAGRDRERQAIGGADVGEVPRELLEAPAPAPATPGAWTSLGELALEQLEELEAPAPRT